MRLRSSACRLLARGCAQAEGQCWNNSIDWELLFLRNGETAYSSLF